MRRIDEKDRLHGGVDAKDVDKYLKRFQPDEVFKGIDVEKEHTNSTATAKEIASDHLGEDPHYYSKLKKIHKESIDVFEFNFHDILEIIWDDPEDRSTTTTAPEKPKTSPSPVTVPKAKPARYSVFLDVSKKNKSKKDDMAWSWAKSFRTAYEGQNILEWDDDVPLGVLTQKVKPEAPKQEKPRSAYHAKQLRTAANKIRRAELNAERRHRYKLDIMKSGVSGAELDASLADYDKVPNKGRIPSGAFNKSHQASARPFGMKITPGREPASEKFVYPAGAKVPRKVDVPVAASEPTPEPAKNVTDSPFKAKKSDPRYSATVKS